MAVKHGKQILLQTLSDINKGGGIKSESSKFLFDFKMIPKVQVWNSFIAGVEKIIALILTFPPESFEFTTGCSIHFLHGDSKGNAAY
jgi:hypothetical protein